MTRFRLFIFMSTLLLVQQATLHAQYKKRGRNVIKDAQGNVSVGHTKDYLKEGKWYESYPDHAKKSFGKYHLGLPEGRHIYYYPSGKVSAIRDFTAGKHNGQWIEFSESGDTIEHRTFNMELLQGYFYAYDAVSETKTKGTYLNGRQSGWWVTISGSTIDSTQYSGGYKTGHQIKRSNGVLISQGYFMNNFPDSVWREYENGKLSHEFWYKSGHPYKTDRTFFPDSDTVRYETRYRTPGDPAMFILYQRPGLPGKVEWYHDHLVDSIHIYHPNGRLQSRNVYVQSPIGYPNKLKLYSGSSTSGKMLFITHCATDGTDSLRLDYNTQGIVIRKVIYDHGSLRGSYYYYDNGKLKLEFLVDTILAYSENGKRLKSGTPAYNKIFAQLDSLEESFGSIPVYSDPVAPDSPIDIHAVHELILIDVSAEFPGGAPAMSLYLRNNIKYPQMELEQGIEGLVVVQFTVKVDGSIANATVVQEVPGGNNLSKEALRVVNKMPLWIPATRNGVPIQTVCKLPINFNLQ